MSMMDTSSESAPSSIVDLGPAVSSVGGPMENPAAYDSDTSADEDDEYQARPRPGPEQTYTGLIHDTLEYHRPLAQGTIDSILTKLSVIHDSVCLQLETLDHHDDVNDTALWELYLQTDVIQDTRKTLEAIRLEFGHDFEASIREGKEDDIVPFLRKNYLSSWLMTASNALQMALHPTGFVPDSDERNDPPLRQGSGPQVWQVVTKAESVLRKAAGMEDHVTGSNKIADYKVLSRGTYPWTASHTSLHLDGLLRDSTIANQPEFQRRSIMEKLAFETYRMAILEVGTEFAHRWMTDRIDGEGDDPDEAEQGIEHEGNQEAVIDDYDLRLALLSEAAHNHDERRKHFAAFNASQRTSGHHAKWWMSHTLHDGRVSALDQWVSLFGSHLRSGTLSKHIFGSGIQARSYHRKMASEAIDRIKGIVAQRSALPVESTARHRQIEIAQLEPFMQEAIVLRDVIMASEAEVHCVSTLNTQSPRHGRSRTPRTVRGARLGPLESS